MKQRKEKHLQIKENIFQKKLRRNLAKQVKEIKMLEEDIGIITVK